ncbi:MAG: hypothetical protein EOP06_01515 [Proteobacteria bacterium]|nr:MAG: hypothetical protein EOP06_01515 [Pseudomonadota bacterium]
MKFIFPLLLLITGCASGPKCGPGTSKSAVYFSPKSCVVRIKEVVIGSELSIPEALKESTSLTHDVSWVDMSVVSGKIQTGHFVLLPKKQVRVDER